MPRPIEAEGNKSRSRAVFTIVQNEGIFLPLWLAYYERYFNRQDIYVLDHNSDDGSTVNVGGRCRLISVHRAESFDHFWLKTTVERFQAFLLQSHQMVLFTEVDEFVIPDPAQYSDLAAYVIARDGAVVRCSGYNIVHQPDELPLRFEMPILKQRRFWQRDHCYDKRLLSNVPLTWTVGFHGELSFGDAPPDAELFLVHLHRVDYATCLARHRAAALRPWNSRDVEERRGFQHLIVEDEAFHQWFYHGPDLAGSALEEIPSRLRDVF